MILWHLNECFKSRKGKEKDSHWLHRDRVPGPLRLGIYAYHQSYFVANLCASSHTDMSGGDTLPTPSSTSFSPEESQPHVHSEVSITIPLYTRGLLTRVPGMLSAPSPTLDVHPDSQSHTLSCPRCFRLRPLPTSDTFSVHAPGQPIRRP